MTDKIELTDADLALGGYRFEDLQELRIVENRTDLGRKQADLGFPPPVKTGKAQALFLKAEVHAWLRKRAALRDAPEPIEPPQETLLEIPQAAKPDAPPRRPVGRPRKTSKAPTVR